MNYLQDLLNSLPTQEPASKPSVLSPAQALPVEPSSPEVATTTPQGITCELETRRLSDQERIAIDAARAVAEQRQRDVWSAASTPASQNPRYQDAVLRGLNLRRVDRCPIHG